MRKSNFFVGAHASGKKRGQKKGKKNEEKRGRS